MTWYRDWFRDANYCVVYEHRDSEEAESVANLVEQTIGRDTTRRVLDLGCGSGRHAIAFAKRGYLVTGIDLSPTLLEEARAEAKKEGLDIRFLERDMRDLPDEQFDLVLNLFTSFGYFERDEESAAVIQTVADRLSVGGYFVLDFLNAAVVEQSLVPHDERIMGNGVRLEQSRWIEEALAGRRIEKRLIIREPNSVRACEYIESVRLFEKSDFERMFQAAHLRVEHIFGGYDGRPFDPIASPRLIFFARK